MNEWGFNTDLVGSSMTLYAKWTPIVNHCVHFDFVGGSAVNSILNVPDNTTIQAPQNSTKEGYTFDGWFYQSNEWDFVNNKVTKAMTLKAQWTKNDVPVIDVDTSENIKPSDPVVKDELPKTGKVESNVFMMSAVLIILMGYGFVSFRKEEFCKTVDCEGSCSVQFSLNWCTGTF